MNNIIRRSWNMYSMVNIEDLRGITFQNEEKGHTFQISGTDGNGHAIPLSGSVSAIFLRPDNTDVAIIGSMSDGIASVTLTDECYEMPGRFLLTVYIASGSQRTVIYAAIGTVHKTSSGTVSPEAAYNVEDLIEAIETVVATIPAEYSDLWLSFAPTFSASRSGGYDVGEYCLYDGGLYVCTTAHNGTWNAAHFAETNLGEGLSGVKSLLYNNRHNTSEFIQGRRNEEGGISDNSSRCSSSEIFYLYVGDQIKISNIVSGHKAAIGCTKDGSLAYDSGWVTSDFEITVRTEGYYYVLEAMADGTSDLTPDSVTTVITVTNSHHRLDVVDDKYSGLVKSVFMPVDNNTAIFNGAGYKTKTGIDYHTGIDHDVGTTGNNYAYLEYIPIVKGAVIHFPQVYPFTMNAFFYDKRKNYLGSAVPNAEFGDLWNVTYQNSEACYVRFACYNSTGHSDAYDEQVFCFAYSETNSNEAEENMNFTSGYCAADGTISNYPSAVISNLQYTDGPIEFHSKDANLNVMAAVYNLSGTFEYTTGEASFAPVPSKKYYRLVIRTADHSPLSIKHIGNVYRRDVCDNIGNVYVNSSGIIQGSNIYIGTIDTAHADTDLMVYCDDWTSYQFSLAFIEDGTVTAYYNYHSADLVVPKGSTYRFSVKNASNVPGDRSLFEHVRLVEIDAAMRAFADIQMNGMNDRLSFIKERIAALEGLNVPSYYQDHITAKAGAIETLYDGLEGDQFIFFTDPHFGGYNNTNHSKSLFNYLINHTHINKIFNGGDMIKTYDYRETMGYGDCAQLLRESLIKSVPDASASYYIVLGNHDTGLDYDGLGNTNGPYVTTQELFDIIGQGYNHPQLVVDPASYGFQYFFDNSGRKMRYIISNILLRDVGGTEGYVASMNFVAQALLSMPSGYSAVIFNHIIVGGSGSVESFLTSEYFPMLDKYNSRETYSYGGNTYNFAECGGEVVCIIGGHTHYDYDTTTAGGIPVVITTTDNAGAESESSGLTRTPGTVSEQAFDVFTIDVGERKVYVTRIGAGQNREFNMRSLS